MRPKGMGTASIWWNSWLLLSFQIFGACAKQCKPPTNSEPGYMKNSLIQSLLGLSPERCIQTCLQTKGCRSVNLHITREICELNNASKTDFPNDMDKKHGFIYLPNSLVTDKIQMISCADLRKVRPSLASGYYWINTKRKRRRVYCDMDRFGGGWTLVVSIDALNNKHLWRAENCADPDTCVSLFETNVPARKLADEEIHSIAIEGVFRVEAVYSPYARDNKNPDNVFYKIPSGAKNFDSSCRASAGIICPPIIVSYKHPYAWESSPCTGIARGYRIYRYHHCMFDGHDDGACGYRWHSSEFFARRMLYGLNGDGNTGIIFRRQGFLWVK
ncbi:uncharacterized protein LOC116617321 [Nematostella vectensis]|uniref:uncharacterized protein LOC116617321 n=1 Tax=Nematostella vectensis TaxID=45351 RepID=UPI00138FF3D8|nr:uncharacterized protein LOC116617321 [Nematostella vectensis]XP_032235835.1 uncharacterized protein LOC116617321 [Nematostella vectensis]